MHQLLVTANVPSSLILVTLMMEVLRSSETSVLTRATWRNAPENDILYSHHRENLRSYKMLHVVGRFNTFPEAAARFYLSEFLF
jgi:hypothetical protein